MATVHQYRIYCTTESVEKLVWGEEEPLKCPDGHGIDASKTRIIQTIEKNVVTINEGDDSLGGHYRTASRRIDIPLEYIVHGTLTSPVTQDDTLFNVSPELVDNIDVDHHVRLNDGTTTGILGRVIVVDRVNKTITTTTPSPASFSTGSTNIECMTITKDYVHKKNIGVLSYGFTSVENNNGDGLEVHVYPNTVIGAITANVSTGSTVLNVSQTVIDNIAIGFFCRLDSGSKIECMGEVSNVDKVNKQITIDKPAITEFLASSPTYVKITVKMAELDDFGAPTIIKNGDDKAGSSLIIRDKIVRVFYNNFTGGEKKFVFYVSHIY